MPYYAAIDKPRLCRSGLTSEDARATLPPSDRSIRVETAYEWHLVQIVVPPRSSIFDWISRVVIGSSGCPFPNHADEFTFAKRAPLLQQ